MKRSLILTICLLVLRTFAFADEGMWIPLLLKQLNETTMKERGMKFSADDIYNINKSSMKDAVVLFGGGCTGEIISDKGLLLTNHHCGFSQIQSHSTLEKNYLKNGFWAYTQEEELACPGLTVTFIVRIEDVTAQITSELSSGMDEAARDAKIAEISDRLEKAAAEGTHYKASVRPFFNGNQFFMMVTETFTDIRMVGAPPSSIGKFGGDTDNWMWPRHTGDFSMFRVYADKDNKPAEYSLENVPYKPKYFFPVSLKGVQPGDFTMVFGFPGRTSEYIPSFAVKNIVEVNDPARIKIRTARLQIIDAAMQSDEQIRIQYAAKQASIANAWKKWQGEVKGLNRLNTISVKQQEETRFKNWVAANNKQNYSTLMSDFESSYTAYAPLSLAVDYINEAAFGVEMIKYANAMKGLTAYDLSDPAKAEEMKKEAEKIKWSVNGFYKNFDLPTDKKLFVAMMDMYSKDVDKLYQPEYFTTMTSKYKGDFNAFADDVYSKSAFRDSVEANKLLTNFNSKSLKKLKADPAYLLAVSFYDLYQEKIKDESTLLRNKIEKLNREYMAGQMEMNPDKKYYPDANSTLRVAFGQVNGYNPRDAVEYRYYSTIDGIIEKEDPSVDEFVVPEKLKQLYKDRDFGRYEYKGSVPVAFVASNHTTGGNSGSPVLNADGELIGTNFDRVWEGTMSDIAFDPEVCRNISLDIRYTLFIIDKYAGCTRLIDEMKIIDSNQAD